MKTERTNLEIARAILEDVYSCLKIRFGMNVDNLDSGIMIKVLDKHFDLHEFDYENINFMLMIAESICKPIHNNPLKYFNFSYKAPRK